MTIQFTQVPSGVRVPGSYVEIDASQSAQQVGANQRILVIAQKISAGSVAALTPTLVTSYNQAVDNFGAGSMAATMFKTLFENNSTTEKWCIPLADSGTQASGTITVTASGALAGTIYLYMGGNLVTVAVAASDSASTIATAIAAAINAVDELQVTASASSAVVTVTAKNGGTPGNKYDMRANYRGPLAGEVYPAGVSLAFVQLANGATDPDITTAFAVMPDEVFDFIVHPWVSTTILDACDTQMDSRWSAMRMLEGHVFIAEKGSVSTVGTLGNARNSEHMTLFDAGLNSPTPSYLWLAAMVGQVAASASLDPATPFLSLPLVGVLAMVPASRRTKAERETLLYDGVATHYVGSDGKVYVERVTTCYQLSSVDLPDSTYLDANTVFTLARMRQEVQARMGARFSRVKLADNGTVSNTGSAIVTPNSIKAELVALGLEWAAKGWMENTADFISTLEVERDGSDPTRVNCVLRPNLVNQLQIFAAQIQFSL